MAYHTIVAMFRNEQAAAEARDALIAQGIPSREITMRSKNDWQGWKPEETGYEYREDRPEHQGFFDWLFGTPAPERDVRTYHTGVSQYGYYVLSCRFDDSAYGGMTPMQVTDIIDRYNPVNIEEDPSTWGTTTTGTTQTASGTVATSDITSEGTTGAAHTRVDTAMPSTSTTAGAAMTGTTSAGMTGTEKVIPTAREEVDIGKRQEEQRYRVRSYVTERPIEKTVTLKEEEVNVDTRPATGAADPGALQERTVEVTAMKEVPVAEKTVKPGEEVVITKTPTERTETVSATERETKVDVDKDKTETSGKPLVTE